MKLLVMLAALLTSFSTYAQLPYNPDANDDGQIGAFDLTALLSVYSTSFSGATEMALYSQNDLDPSFGNWHCSSSTPVNSWVIDGHLHQGAGLDFAFITVDQVVNGTTLNFLIPANEGLILSVDVVGYEYPVSTTIYLSSGDNRLYKMVFWNDTWHLDW